MKKLEIVLSDTPMEGYIIESFNNTYALRHYFKISRNEFDVDDGCLNLDSNEEADVLKQNSLAEKIQKLHYYFEDADYISYNVIEQLNSNNENIFKALRDIVIF